MTTPTVEDFFIDLLNSPASKITFNELVKLLQEVATKEALTQADLRLIHGLFQILPRGTGERNRLEFLVDRLSCK